ncbi:ATP-binding protein [Piscinibacter sp. HJYY11]|uniref:hybrid sensor histidine kinase/response regulator n=1 Tax=Piscinibacter sp. HJYY11 TaxID=2801333 RepID=UPI00191D39BD|nr:ATP-binding protein [Piscinibacter sp. HJYY11]MBL0726511.1 response regulator [Piscinibacter sp. HJYY11]
MRIRSLLLLVLTVVFVPGFLAAVMAVQKVREGERAAALNALRETVRASALLVDVEIQRSIGTLTALGESASLSAGDLATFYEEARAANRPPHVWTLLFDESGQQLLNTYVPFGTTLPQAPADRIRAVFESGRPQVSDLTVGAVSGKLLTLLYLPTRRLNGKRYVVAHAYSVDHWRATALQVENGSPATIGVFDGSGRFISRNVNADTTLGKPARPELVAAAASAAEGVLRHYTLEGVDVYDAFTHSEQTGWTVAVAMPVHAIERSVTQAVLWLAASGLLALGCAMLAAYVFGRTFMRVIETASGAAQAVGAGQAPQLRPTRLEEVNILYGALADAGRVLTQERQSREAAEREREELLARETALRETAERENTAKDQFLALLGHELRNPLAAIAGATAVLSHERSTPEAREKFLGIIQRQNRHLGHIVNDLLDVSRLMSGKIVLETRRINLAEWVTSCAEALRATEKAAQHEIVVQAEEAWIYGDGVRIEQIVNNLVFNSLKCSPAGSQVIITVRNDGEHVRLSVQDFGIGITADLLPRVFEPFVQGPPPPGRMSSGLGIGLALVKQLVGLHGGEVHAYSAGPGLGATFTVILPRAEAGTLPGQRIAPTDRRARHVLLVEDDRDAMAAMSELLRLMGHEVVHAGNRDEALAAVETRRVDLALIDIGLPGQDGYEVASELRNRAGSRRLPLIALTGFGRDADRVRALAAGFDRHLSKPVDAELLARTIEEATASQA